MTPQDPLRFDLQDGTHVTVIRREVDCYEFHLARLNSERHNFYWKNGRIEESYETRFDELQKEAVEHFQHLVSGARP